MKICKTIPMFILLLTGYPSNNMDVAATTETITTSPESTFLHISEVTHAPANTAPPPQHNSSPASKVMHAHESETPPHGSDYYAPGIPLSALLVAGISIFFVFLILVTIGVCYAWKKSRGSSDEMNPVPLRKLDCP